MTDTTEQREKLMADLKLVVADAEALLQATAGQAGEGMAELRARVQTSLNQAKDGLINVQHAVVERARATAKATDEYVNENPWSSVGIAAGVGLLVGLLIGRR